MKIIKNKTLRAFFEHESIKDRLLRLPRFLFLPFALGNRLEITRHRIEIAGLPDAMDGFRIVHLTDFHAAEFRNPRRLEGVIRKANDLQPDLIALTGDYLGYSPHYCSDSIDRIGRLRARHGVFAVLGNHDLWQPTCLRMVDDFEKRGIRVLRNGSATLQTDAGSICVMGVDDARAGVSDLDAATEGSARADVRLLLAHHPDSLFSLNGHAPHLALTGHTHGGQINLPLFGPVTYFSKFTERHGVGMVRSNGTYIYNSRGLGTCLIPVRIRCRPEIAVFTLARKPE